LIGAEILAALRQVENEVGNLNVVLGC
jgi:hypothetical protein